MGGYSVNGEQRDESGLAKKLTDRTELLQRVFHDKSMAVRDIEVKGVSGEWNQTGVGLSKVRFQKAQDCGERYWLYVVEFVSDSQRRRVHPIQDPATKVTTFMFDGNWRDVATK